MSAISLSSFSSRSSQGAYASLQPQRGNTYGSYNSGARTNSTAATSRSSTVASSSYSAARTSSGASTATGRSTASTSSNSAYCPTCGGNVSRSASPSSSSYCPTCNRTGGTQSNITAASRSTTTATVDHAHTYGQGGRVCVTCGYQGR